MPTVYRRVLLKLSGEALAGGLGHGVDPATAHDLALELAQVQAEGAEVGVVLGGGNFLRGVQAVQGGQLDRVRADQAGMLGTTINALLLGEALRAVGAHAVVLSAVPMPTIAESYTAHAARAHLAQGRIAIFSGGTGLPYFSTDSAAALRALEIQADVLVKATKVDGIYSADPRKDPSAELLPSLRFEEVLQRRLAVMDMAAFALCLEQRLPIAVVNMTTGGNLLRVVRGEAVGSWVR